jgi:predicted ribosomally synthesized peptide with SipW-like signal peptide
MRNIVLSLVVVAALVGAGVGGTLADFSDYEVSEDNYFATGSMDLVISDEFGNEYNGETVPEIWRVDTGWPCCSKDRSFDIHNAGENEQQAPIVYLHFKNIECDWLWPKIVYLYVLCDDGECVDELTPEEWDALTDDEQDALLEAGYKPVTEPEYVAECGGVAGEDADGEPVEVPGIGCLGEDCTLSRHVDVTIRIAGPYTGADTPATAAAVPEGDWDILDLDEFDDDPENDIIKLNELECEQIELGPLPGCYTFWVNVSLHLQDIDEDDLIDEGVLTDPGTGYGWFDDTKDAEAKWDHWPSNALQADVMFFDLAFELLQY